MKRGEPLKGLPNHLLIFVPAFLENVNAQTMISIAKLSHVMGCLDVEVTVGSMSFPDITTLRNGVFTGWMDGTNYSHLLWVDADMGFQPQLVLDMLAWDVPLIGAIYPKKVLDLEDPKKKEWVLTAHDGQHKISECQGFLEVDGLGFGCVLMRRDCGQAMVDAYPDLVCTDMEGDAMGPALKNMGAHRIINVFDLLREDTGKKVSEDYSFCRRYKAIGGEIWAAVKHELTHTGPYTWKGAFGNDNKIIITS